jgi:hypothetical protein
MSKGRIFVAFAVAPLAVPLVFGLVSALANPSDPGYGLFTFGMTLIYLPVIYLATCILGIPVWLLFRYYGVGATLAFVMGGAAIGWVVAGWFIGAWFTRYDLEFALAGSTSATLFRAIVGYRQPKLTRS